jgi:ATP-dependent Lon protease
MPSSKKMGAALSPAEKKREQKKRDKKMKQKKNHDDSDDDSEVDSEDYETVSDSDSTYVPPKFKKNKKRVVEDDDDEDEDDDEDYDEDDDDDDEDDEDYEEPEMSKTELKKFISRVFPSKYMTNRVKQALKEEKEEKKSSKKASSSSKHRKDKRRRKARELDDEDDEDEDDDDYDEDEDDEDYDEEDLEDEEKGMYSIVFTMDGEEQDECAYNEEEDDADCDSDDEQMFMKETYEKVDASEIAESKKKATKILKKKKQPETEEQELTDVEQEYLELVETKKNLAEQLKKKPKNKILKNAISECNRSIKKLVKKARIKNAKTYHKLIHTDKKRTNEVDYFKKKLSNKEQLRIMKDLKEINNHINIEKPYRLALLDSSMPAKFKAIAMQKLNVLRGMDPGDNEYYKIKNWVDTFMRIPFGSYNNLSVTMDDGLDKCHDFMENAKKTLDDCVFGLNDAKLQIMQMIGQWITNPSAMGTAIAIKGPMGTGKTTLVKEGISKILGREFAFIALGGTGDASFLEGHSYTYEGSTWGKIVQILIDSKCMNPVIYFDELDKISDTPRGEEIVGILTHLTDTSQNSQFHDKYFSEIDFDLSKCLFIFSYNDESKVNPILRDRMYRIQTKGYDSKEKVTISGNYLLPKIREQVNFKDEDIIIPEDTLQYIISNSALTNEEAGVRNLKRCLEIIYTKLNLFRLVKTDSSILGKDIDLQVSFPFTVTRKVVDVLIKNEERLNQSVLAMYV